jgi:hypothetical protein
MQIENCILSPSGGALPLDGVGVGSVSLIGTSITGGMFPNPALTYASNNQFWVQQQYFWNTVSITTGTGDPSAGLGVPASQGSLFLRTDGGANTTLYVKEGAADTAWAAK